MRHLLTGGSNACITETCGRRARQLAGGLSKRRAARSPPIPACLAWCGASRTVPKASASCSTRPEQNRPVSAIYRRVKPPLSNCSLQLAWRACGPSLLGRKQRGPSGLRLPARLPGDGAGRCICNSRIAYGTACEGCRARVGGSYLRRSAQSWHHPVTLRLRSQVPWR